jgi:hypothetical protein
MRINLFLKKLFFDEQPGNNNSGHFDELISKAWAQQKDNTYWWALKATDIAVFNEDVLLLSDKRKAAFMAYLLINIHNYYNLRSSYSSNDTEYGKKSIQQSFLSQLFRMKITLDEDDIEMMIRLALRYNKRSGYPSAVPLKGILNQVQKKYSDGVLPPKIDAVLTDLKLRLKNSQEFCPELEASKLLDQLAEITSPSKTQFTPVLFPGDDELPQLINSTIAALTEVEKSFWYSLIARAKKITGARPSKKFLDECGTIIQNMGAARFKEMITPWFEWLIGKKELEKLTPQILGGTTYQVSSYSLTSAPSTECLKGLIWMCAALNDTDILYLIDRLAERAYRKIPGYGQTSTVIGNACLYTLCKTEGLEGIGHLSRLKTRIKANSTLNLIEKYILQSAGERGLSVQQIESMAVEDFGLREDTVIIELPGYTACIRIEKVGKVKLTWQKADGTVQKSDPLAIKESHPGELKRVKSVAKQIELSLSAQRDRIDSSFKAGIKFDPDHFYRYYFNHGLMGYLSRRLIWTFKKAEETIAAYWLNGEWVDHKNQVVAVTDANEVWLWHPASATVEEVRLWRNFFMEKEIQQPIKQAFREVYLLTDAEINTRTYSNRMASHLLKQHQFNSLTKARNWKYMLQGQFDNGANGTASISLPAFGLYAEYWTEAVDAVDGVSDTGIFNYVSTDQVKFINSQTKENVQLIDVPVEVFSEVMRDVDLFVGVCSVGNDPEWRDNGGLPNYRNYWQSYSFGDLTEAGKGRREILERLLPALKIARVAHLKDKFLVVRGKKRTYKIHLGSTNILMEPNDQYLCIVPDRSQKNVTENVFLPFEGDLGLSVIISKAFLLAGDDKITDPTILSQINF